MVRQWGSGCIFDALADPDVGMEEQPVGPGERTLVQVFAAHDLRTRDDHFFVLRGPQVRHLQAHRDDISDGVADFDQVAERNGRR